MPPPSRPASQQTARPYSTIVPPHINARETHPAPNPNPVYAPAHVSLAGHFQPPIGAAPVYPHGSPAVNYSIDAGLMGHPDGDRAQLAYEGNSQGNFEVQSDHHLNTGPPNGSDTIQYFVPEDGELIPVSPDRSASPGRLSQARDILEVNHDTLQAMFRLSEADQHLARSILVMSEANIMGAIVYGVLANQRTPPATPALDPNPAENTIVRVEALTIAQADIRNFLYSDYIKDEIRDFIRRKMIESRIVAYSRHLDNDGVAEPRALLTLTQAHVASLPVNIQRQHLPPGFTGGNNHARRSVLQLVRNLLKHDRVLLRNLLLKNIVDTSHAKVRGGGVPSLQMLYTSIHNAFLENSGVHAPRINWDMLPMRIKVRFAYLRLETAAHTSRNTPGHGSQWTPIDEHLCRFRWADAIMALDHHVFGAGGVVFAHVRHLVQMPTDQEIQDIVDTNGLLPVGERPSQPVMEDDQFNLDA
ncbi:hypothetical protein PGT21_001138 [Puccinia graminis f. sp. tritici]|uniref:Uncharacterized protein n=1 Tax=Puccinia graminis f. sp. tritici TaxID=56615 RepID=A0A5B0QM35_PUCGR|nr:hypothetical protein PGT21_001138 [Puccinia graminis f. sp. tritici]